MADRQRTSRCILLPLVFLLWSCLIGRSFCREEEEEDQQRQQQQQQQQRQQLIPLVFLGSLRNDLGEPVEDARVQFWHTDSNGRYFHPRDNGGGGASSSGSDESQLMADEFSYFGMAATDSDGTFRFKTYRPGIYESRPITHIHFKVLLLTGGEVGGEVGDTTTELLTSQFYFSDESAADRFDDMLRLDLENVVVANETETHDNGAAAATTKRTSLLYLQTSKTIVVDTNGGEGNEPLTPAQQEGPFYPLVSYEDFEKAGSDMTAGGLPEEFYARYADNQNNPTAASSSASKTAAATTRKTTAASVAADALVALTCCCLATRFVADAGNP